MKVEVTQEVLNDNPCLVEQGVKIGEEIELGPLCNEDGTPIEEPPATTQDVIGDGTRPTKGPK